MAAMPICEWKAKRFASWQVCRGQLLLVAEGARPRLKGKVVNMWSRVPRLYSISGSVIPPSSPSRHGLSFYRFVAIFEWNVLSRTLRSLPSLHVPKSNVIFLSYVFLTHHCVTSFFTRVVFQARAAARPAIHVRPHSLRARIRCQRGLRKGTQIIWRCLASLFLCVYFQCLESSGSADQAVLPPTTHTHAGRRCVSACDPLG